MNPALPRPQIQYDITFSIFISFISYLLSIASVQCLPSSRKVIHIIFSRNKICKRIFIHIRYSSSPGICSVTISRLYWQEGSPTSGSKFAQNGYSWNQTGKSRQVLQWCRQNFRNLGHLNFWQLKHFDSVIEASRKVPGNWSCEVINWYKSGLVMVINWSK